ncbi:MAG TPA: hypothetical protein VE195_01660 [Acidobacteriaceae bacterium]|nr:hypothetical protein [Acidobacteriaceae bacterium]
MRTFAVRAIIRAGLLPALICSSPTFLYAQSSNAAALAAYGNCPAPSHQGVKICSPELFQGNSEIDAPFQMIASGTSGKSQVKLMELWVDGKKVTQTDGTPFDQTVALSPGTHRIAVIELDSVGAIVESTPFQLTIDGNNPQPCSPPATPGVNVCIPAPNSCHTSAWTSVSAAGKGNSGTVSRMELWINGVKIANVSGGVIDTNLYVNDFSKITIVEVDSKGVSRSSPAIVVQSC